MPRPEYSASVSWINILTMRSLTHSADLERIAKHDEDFNSIK